MAVYKWRATVGTQVSAKSQALGLVPDLTPDLTPDLVPDGSCCKNAVNVDLPFATLRPFGLFWAENGNGCGVVQVFKASLNNQAWKSGKCTKTHRF